LGGRGARGAQMAQARKRGGPSEIQRAKTTREGERREVRCYPKLSLIARECV